MTTIVSVRRNNVVAVGGDGQVTMGQSSVLKANAVKVRRLFKGKVIAGFAGFFNLFASPHKRVCRSIQ